MQDELIKEEQVLFDEIVQIINDSRRKVLITVNTELVLLYWNIGCKLNTCVLGNQRAGYGKEIVKKLSISLQKAFGKGWDEKTLRHCLRCAETFTEAQIVSAVRRQLSWTHIKTISYLKNNVQREFYLTMSSNEGWSSRQLQERINSMLYERTAISKKPELVIKNDLELLQSTKEMTADLTFKDPYILDFLGLRDTYNESDLEQAIIYQLQLFILELGNDFAFLARQKRIAIDDTDYYIDLLFYHRKLRRLVAIDLKMGKFEHSHKSQMELYLRWLAKYEQQSHELSPIGLILCADKNDELVELLELDAVGIHVAQYLLELPSKELLKQKLHMAIAMAKQRVNAVGDGVG
ncbi:PDDEXK nuclease domain-containing protein [Chitinophaga horti]|uniref:PDDEXK nuclease domain-containing protein n=1 Tax=Chitinophaga horti TaxID=2920382 RepID=A0ABY6IWF6_9BACT|nr:PDDEXK nuclease domain-containing protein [Chitinophaga horti]UYQ91715.1 PDDEXK nuclease domain-containing protein [Chitinophaga horti]